MKLVLGDCSCEAVMFLVMGRKTTIRGERLNLLDRLLPQRVESGVCKFCELERAGGRVVVVKGGGVVFGGGFKFTNGLVAVDASVREGVFSNRSYKQVNEQCQ